MQQLKMASPKNSLVCARWANHVAGTYRPIYFFNHIPTNRSHLSFVRS